MRHDFLGGGGPLMKDTPNWPEVVFLFLFCVFQSWLESIQGFVFGLSPYGSQHVELSRHCNIFSGQCVNMSEPGTTAFSRYSGSS